ncbi:PIN domain-containing protein [Curtobacterium sp. AB7]|uniref:PIN domain-containing protein n=1 Tax=Curtobacterium sp. AB7 TaxID=3349327 RepID=UPI003833EA94
MRIAVYPDTNAFFSDRFLRRQYSLEFLAALDGGDVQLFIPPTVIAETLRQAREAANERTNQLRAAFRRSDAQSNVPGDAIRTAINDYAAAVVDEAETALGLLVAHPAVSVLDQAMVRSEDLVARELDRRRPFLEKSAGSVGLRDTMIWLSMLEHFDAVSYDHILVITNDGGFLSGDKTTLHSDLLKDLDDWGIERSRVHTQPDLQHATIEFRRLRHLISEREAALTSAAVSFTQALIRAPWGTSQAAGAFSRSIASPPAWLHNPVVTTIEDVAVQSIGDGEWATCVIHATAVFRGHLRAADLADATDAEVVVSGDGDDSYDWWLDATSRARIGVTIDIELNPEDGSTTIEDYAVEFLPDCS